MSSKKSKKNGPENVMVVYYSDDETIICMPCDEKKMLDMFFCEGSERNACCYERTESTGYVQVRPNQKVDAYPF